MRSRKEMSVFYKAAYPLLWGLGAGVALCVVLLLAASAIMATGVVPPPVITPLALGISTLSAAVGGFVSAAVSRKRGWLYGALTGLLLFIVLALVGMTMGGESGVQLLLKAALAVVGALVGGVFGVNAKKR